MRIKVDFVAEDGIPYGGTRKHDVQAFIYSLLMGTEYDRLHDGRGFKFFTFSNFFPGIDVRPGDRKSFVISSPDEGFIETLYEKLLPVERFYIGGKPLRIEAVKKFRLRPTGRFITGSPVVVRSITGRGFFTFHHENSLDHFIRAITENAVAKYTAFTGEPFQLDGPIFERMVPYVRKKGWIDVYVRVNIRGRYFDVPGSNWKLLQARITPDNRDFYAFLMDAGLGILNSLGFGFINPIKPGNRGRTKDRAFKV